MSKSFTERKRIRRNFGVIEAAAAMPNLIAVQRRSYDNFLQKNVDQKERKNIGLQSVLQFVFPIEDFSGSRCCLEFVSYDLGDPKYSIEECQQRDMTYAAPLKATLRLIVWDVDEEAETRSIRDIREQDVYLGDIPLMTPNGTFVINGTERVVVSQMHRSPGVFFDHDNGKTHSSGKYLFNVRVIPYRGSWLDFEFDGKDFVNVRIDRRRKLLATTFLKALDSKEAEKQREKAEKEGVNFMPEEASGMSNQEILSTFYSSITCSLVKKGWKIPFSLDIWKGIKPTKGLVDASTGEEVSAAGRSLTPRAIKRLQEKGVESILVGDEWISGKYLAQDLIDSSTGEVLAEAGGEINEALLSDIREKAFKNIDILHIGANTVGPYIRNTLAADKNSTREEALIDIFRVMRPGEPPTVESATALFKGLFFDEDRYDLSGVGRVKMNSRLGFESDDKPGTLRKKDIIEIIRILVGLKDGVGSVDDIDNLGNRRVRSVGELLENQLRVGFVRLERSVKERMSSLESETVMPHDLINAKPLVSILREFFGTSQLSQFMDQTNPLSEITHKRRLSALGPGGLSRDRAGFEVRDVHLTHYGRICPIETPEGPNIGLINSLSTFARINKYGFIEAPYRKVRDRKITDEVVYLSAMEEKNHTIAQANAELDKNGCFKNDIVSARRDGEFMKVPVGEVDMMDVSPKQVVSVAASLIPFLENDDANRALMGSNMQRQAVPLLCSEKPLVGTGMEAAVAADSGASIVARHSGVVDRADANKIVIKVDEKLASEDAPDVDIYTLRKFQRSNQDTCINQKSLVKVGDIVKQGDIIADGPSTDLGELALGRNALVAFMPWNGYNFEDSILISERLVSDDVYTSIHIQEFEMMARDTKLGNEEITRDIPNVGEEALKHLDESGIVHIGADVKPGDILVGKVTPKGESPMTPEEKLLRAIFGEKASDVRDSSLRLPPGVQGTVVEVRVFNRRGVEKDERALAIEHQEIVNFQKDRDTEKEILDTNFYSSLKSLLLDHTVVAGPKGFKKNAQITEDLLGNYTQGQWRQFTIKDSKAMDRIERLGKQFDLAVKEVDERFDDRVDKLRRGDDLLPGVMKMVKVFVAVKRKIQSGDKLAGRHGNKGIVSLIVPAEDMPYLEDGRPVDVVLSPLGVPSRMNVGQILETHLGWAAAGLGRKIADALEVYKHAEGSQVSEQTFQDLKQQVASSYHKKEDEDSINAMDKDAVLELAGNLKDGVPMATPVFDGAKEKDINKLLKEAGLEESGQVTLYDGRTGEAFDRKITVGYMYILKLHHLIDDKIHARSIGPYSLVTQQPLGGKAQFGGQRFGEMEVWALEAYGAAYTLQEMLTVKSDDVVGRAKVYESIVRGDAAATPGMPESFNVLVKELKSLAIDVDFLKEDSSL